VKRRLLLSALLACASVQAGDTVASCQSKGLPELGTPQRALLVAIDQTTTLNPKLQQLVADNVKPFLAPGNSFTVLVFSAYTQGHYTQVLTSGALQPQLPASSRDDVAKPLLAKLDQCLQRQSVQAAQAIGQALRTAYQGTSGTIAKSDVLASVKTISAVVRQLPAQEKIVLLVSDMLENSSVANFYAEHGQAVRLIDAAREMKLAAQQQLLGDFGGAEIYVMGAGLLPANVPAKSYRDPKTMQALQAFWRNYFAASQGKLMEFGQPALLNRIR
jgi:hypothetical protein